MYIITMLMIWIVSDGLKGEYVVTTWLKARNENVAAFLLCFDS